MEKEKYLEETKKEFQTYEVFLNPIDSRIIKLCKENPKTINELITELNLSGVNVWKHINKLSDLNFVEKDKIGKFVYVKITKWCNYKENLFLDMLGFMLNTLRKDLKSIEEKKTPKSMELRDRIKKTLSDSQS